MILASYIFAVNIEPLHFPLFPFIYSSFNDYRVYEIFYHLQVIFDLYFLLKIGDTPDVLLKK